MDWLTTFSVGLRINTIKDVGVSNLRRLLSLLTVGLSEILRTSSTL